MKILPSLLMLCLLVFLTPPTLSQSAKKKQRTAPSNTQSARHIMSAKEIFAKYHDFVYTIKTDKAQGTGFMDGSFLTTCFHVIDGSSSVKAISPSGEVFDMKTIWALDQKLDFVKFVDRKMDRGPIAKSFAYALEVGDPLYVIGSPQGLAQTLTVGILSGRRTIDGIEHLQLSAAISPGSSGSPVFNKYGDIVAMVTATVQDGQQLNFAIGLDSLNRIGVPLNLLFGQNDKNDVEQRTRDQEDAKNGVLSAQFQLLEGLSKFCLVVGVDGNDANLAGLTDDIVTMDISLKLNQSGIPYYYIDEAVGRAKEKNPTLIVSVETSKRMSLYAYYITVSVRQNAWLSRDTKLRGHLQTWSIKALGTVGSENLLEVRDIVRNLVDKFVSDYFKVNSRK